MKGRTSRFQGRRFRRRPGATRPTKLRNSSAIRDRPTMDRRENPRIALRRRPGSGYWARRWCDSSFIGQDKRGQPFTDGLLETPLNRGGEVFFGFTQDKGWNDFRTGATRPNRGEGAIALLGVWRHNDSRLNDPFPVRKEFLAMSLHPLQRLLALLLIGVLAASPAMAEDDGQEDLDRAIEAKLSAESFRELATVA